MAMVWVGVEIQSVTQENKKDPSKLGYSDVSLTSISCESENQLHLRQTHGPLLAFKKFREIKNHACSHGTSLEAGAMDIVT